MRLPYNAGARVEADNRAAREALSTQELRIARPAPQGWPKREIREAAVAVTAYRRLAPVPHLPEAEHHVAQRVVVPHRRQ